jgi:hypothetical protein
MKVDKNIRNLLFKQSETLVIDFKHCIYLGETYSYPKMTRLESQTCLIELDKIINPKNYLIDRLKRILGL